MRKIKLFTLLLLMLQINNFFFYNNVALSCTILFYSLSEPQFSQKELIRYETIIPHMKRTFFSHKLRYNRTPKYRSGLEGEGLECILAISKEGFIGLNDMHLYL